MSFHDDAVYVSHMLEAAKKAVKYATGMNRIDLDADELRSLALVRLVHIIGEAARRLSPPFRASYPDIPWRQIIGTRDRLVHGYEDFNHDIVWIILKEDLPALIALLERLVPPDGPSHIP